MRLKSRIYSASRLLSKDEWVLFIVALTSGIAMAIYIESEGLMKALTDQNSHLNFARLTFDSLTPGISQLGFWPPLLHVLLIPFVAFDPLYSSGLAGACVLLVCLIISTLVLYKITFLFTHDRVLSFIAGLIFVFNPFVLYYSVTPMMEMLFVANLFLATYFMIRWLETDRLRDILLCAIFIALSCLSRFEGFLLLPIAAAIIFFHLRRRRISRHEIQALFLLFGLLALLGIVIVISYSMVFSSSPLSFMGGDWIRDPAENLRAAKFNVLYSLRDIFFASLYMLGTTLLLAGTASFFLILAFPERRYEKVSALFLLGSPLLFVFISLFTGSITINVPDLPPYAFFHNDRYTLTSIGFVILTTMLLIHSFSGLMRKVAHSVFWHRTVTVIIVVPLILSSFFRLYDVAIAENFNIIRKNINSPKTYQIQAADFFRSQYDYGFVLAARVDNDPILTDAGIPLRRYIYEGNYKYFDQALSEPWIFARWVMMHNPAISENNWVEDSEPIYRSLHDNEQFLYYYDLIFENEGRRIYKLNTNHVLHLAMERKVDVRFIPSLNSTIGDWDPRSVYQNMAKGLPSRVSSQEMLDSKTLVHAQLIQFYWDRLKPDYPNGYYRDQSGHGNSESQSYALLQSLFMDDQEQFETVWNWTRTHIQRSDSLFSWKFSVDPYTGDVRIEDPNSATDADTDIALALLLAGEKWSKPDYIQAALPIIANIWNLETALSIRGRHVIAGNWGANSGSLIINPSYFSPAAYRAFAKHDNHSWDEVIRTGYEDLRLASRRPDGTFLPPDWSQIDPATGNVSAFSDKPNGLDYSYDAFRVFWRVALDSTNGQSESMDYLSNISIFSEEWKKENRLCTVYIGQVCRFDMGTLTGPLSAASIADPAMAETILQTFYFSPGQLILPKSTAFYEKSWYWFGLWQWSNAQMVE